MTIARFINNLLLWITLLAFAAQFIIDFSSENIAANCIMLTPVMATLLYFRWSKALETHPLSSFAIFGFCVTSQLGALLAQSAAWTAVGTSLRQPLITFSMLGMYLAIALLTHALYRVMAASPSRKPGLLRHMFLALGIYATPSALNLWIMGATGAFFLLLSRVSPVANGFSFLAWSPFLIPIFAAQSGTAYCHLKRNYFALVAYAVLIAVIAMAFNGRGMLLSGAATVTLLFLLVGMRSTNLVNRPMLMKLGMVGLLAAVLSWPVSDLVTAMAVTRSDRGKASASEMVNKTLENFRNPEKLEVYRRQSLAHDLRTQYDEKYINNPMLARFVITKFHDNAFYFAGKLSDAGSEEVLKISGDFLWTTLPQPWLDALKIDVHKEKLQFTIGDLLAHEAVGTPLSGKRTGSIFGQGWAIFGYLFPAVYFAICLVLFAAMDIFSIQTASGSAVLAVIGMLNVWPNFLFGITADSLQHLIDGVVRGVPQSVLLYAILFVIAKFISNVLLAMIHGRSPALAVKGH
jgi:hypothetical protein